MSQGTNIKNIRHQQISCLKEGNLNVIENYSSSALAKRPFLSLIFLSNLFIKILRI